MQASKVMAQASHRPDSAELCNFDPEGSPGSIVNKSNGWSLMLRAMSSVHRLTKLPSLLVLARAYNFYDAMILPASLILRKDSLLMHSFAPEMLSSCICVPFETIGERMLAGSRGSKSGPT
jgi:hypothetical protein